ncbi:hypothetical protein ACROYT_G001181 [Oculina patagonica]
MVEIFTRFFSIIYFVYRLIMKGICFVILALLVVSATSRRFNRQKAESRDYGMEQFDTVKDERRPHFFEDPECDMGSCEIFFQMFAVQ